MKYNLKYRNYKKEDKKELLRLLREKRKYVDFFEDEKYAEKYTKMALSEFLGTCTYKKVAVAGEKIIGAVIGMKKDRTPILLKLKRKLCCLHLKIKRKNREALRCFSMIEDMEEDLIKSGHVSQKNLLALFLIDKKYGKTEIWQNLLEEWEKKIDESPEKVIYAFACSKSEQQFLEEHSFQVVDEKVIMIQPRDCRYRFRKTLLKKRKV